MMTNELIKKERELDKTKDEIAMRIGYKVLEINNLLNQYKEAEKSFLEGRKGHCLIKFERTHKDKNERGNRQ